MNILVTGVAGFIGSVVTELLLGDGHKVIGIDNFQEGKSTSVNKDILFYEGDYGDRELLNKIFSNYEINCIFHFAAETTIEFSISNPSIYFKNNVVNGINLLEEMLRFDIKKIIFSSSAAIYGEPKYIPIDENHQKVPVNAYGESKLMFENILDWYHKAYGIKFNLFRYFNAGGATNETGENRKNETHLLPLIFKSLLCNDNTLKVYGQNYSTVDGTCVRDYVHVIDIAQAHILGLGNLTMVPNGKYNLGSGIGYSILEIIKVVEKVTEKKIKWKYEKNRTGDPAILVASNDLAVNELGWEPKNSSIEKIVEASYTWFKKNLSKL